MTCCKRKESNEEIVLNSGQEAEQKDPTCCGRKVSRCTCMTQKTLSIIATIIGSIILLVGILGLAGYLAPASGIGSAASFVAAKLGSDLFTLTMFAVSIGGTFTALGVIGLCLERRKKNGNEEPLVVDQKETSPKELKN